MPQPLSRQAPAFLRQCHSARNKVLEANSEVCLLCRSHNLTNRRALSTARRPKLLALQARQYTETSSTSPKASRNGVGAYGRNSNLHNALAELQKTAGSYVDISKLQLALRGLEQGAGNETIRIAVMGLGGKQDSLSTVKKLLRLILADPLKEEQEWERILVNESHEKPVLLCFGSLEAGAEGKRARNNLIQEIYIHSPTLAGHQLEILVLETDAQDSEGDILVPTIEIPTSSTGRHTPITTPVHKAIVLGDGLLDAATITKFLEAYKSGIIGAALNLPGYIPEERPGVPFPIIDIKEGTAALSSIRQSVENAITYEHQWFQSGLPVLLDWIKSGTESTEGVIKAPMVNLIESVLSGVNFKIQDELTTRSAQLSATKVPSPVLQSLRKGLEEWAEKAHTELRDDLDIAFQGRRWRKLTWYKLFWRVDDVSHISSDILSQRFLTTAEKEIIHLSGKIEQAGILSLGINCPTSYESWANARSLEENRAAHRLGGKPPPMKLRDIVEVREDTAAEISALQPHPWPMHIPATKTYLIQQTVPTLQALAQKLVLETLSTSSISTALAGLLYVSSMTIGLYEVGAVAAFGIVWSLRRMQRKWETARGFWEGEVREEGRRAVRGVEGVVSDVLVEGGKDKVGGKEELERVEEVVERVRVALEEVKGSGEKEKEREVM